MVLAAMGVVCPDTLAVYDGQVLGMEGYMKRFEIDVTEYEILFKTAIHPLERF